MADESADRYVFILAVIPSENASPARIEESRYKSWTVARDPSTSLRMTALEKADGK